MFYLIYAAIDYISFRSNNNCNIKKVDHPYGPNIHIYSYIVKRNKLSTDFKPQKIVFMFHGIADEPIHFLSWTQPTEENILYIVIQAFEPFKIFGLWKLNYQWFNIGSIRYPDESKIRSGLEKIRPLLFKIINDAQSQYEIPWECIFLTGFSLGAIVAYDLLTHSDKIKYAAVVSGVVDPHLKISQAGKTILSVYSEHDIIVPATQSKESESRLKELGATVLSHIVKRKGGGAIGNHCIVCSEAYTPSLIWGFVNNPETFFLP
jgi:predicted esterase